MTAPTQQQIAALTGPDPVAASQAARELAAIAQAAPTDLVVTAYDHFYRSPRIVANYIELRATFTRLDMPTGTLNLMGCDPFAPAALNCDNAVVPITVQLDGLRWSGRITVAHDKINRDGTETVECQLIGDLAILDAILVWPLAGSPIEFQPSEAIYMGPAITVIKTMVAENAWRLQVGWNEFINELGSGDENWDAWFGTLLSDGAMSITQLNQMVSTPVCVIFDDALTDTSPWVNIHGRMDSCWKLMRQVCRDNGLYPSIDLWLPGDPQPKGVTYPLTVATYVFNVRDYEGVTGPTATSLDGGIEEVVDLADSLLGNVIKPFLNPDNEYVPPGSNIEIAPALGVNYIPPWVEFNADVPDSGIVELDIAHHHPLAYQTILGGRSPQWLNAFFNATSSYLIDILTIAIGVSGIPDDMLDGIIDNAIMAFQVFEWPDTRKAMGPYAFPEKFFPMQSTYDADATFGAINAGWEIKGYPAAKVSWYNGFPYRLGRDIGPGRQASVIRRGIRYTDYLDEITILDNRQSLALVTATIGDGRRDESPATLIQRKIVEAEDNINLLLLAAPS